MNFLLNFARMATGYASPVMNLVKRRWLRTLIWALAACLVVFFYGDALRLRNWTPLESDTTRIEVCAFIILCWAGYLLFTYIRDRKANKDMIAALTAEGPSKSDMSAQELDQVRGRLQEALTELRRVGNGRRGYVYQLPWYLMIGPPGSGKTTALLNSGLKFPLAESMGKDPLRGVGGTRNCEWWFTEDAIMLDTAGRYTTQDSDPEIDKKGWTGFLDLLKTYRPLQPINGVIVALSLEEIAYRDPQERLAAAQAIRTRLGELTRAFGSRFPVYVLLTKVDLLAGFVQFFDSYSRSDREQVWGMTFPLDDGKPETQAAASRFDIEFDGLLTRMNAIVLERLQQETDIQRRGLIFGFPIQVATVKEPLKEVLDEVFATSKFDQRPLLRGVYFASSTQSGAPTDRMMHAMATTFGMEMPRQPAFAGQEKSYFLTRLLDKVVFAEASVVAADPKTRRRMLMTRNIAAAVASVLVAAFLGAWTYAYLHNRAPVARTDRQIAEYRTAVEGIPTKDVADTDFDRIIPPLNLLADGPAKLDTGAPWLQFGLNQSAKLQSQYSSLYSRALDVLMLPRVLVVLQKQLRGAKPEDTELKVAALKVYLGLGGSGPLDKPFARKWMAAQWLALYPQGDAAGKRADLDRHFAALLETPIDPIALDANLVSDVRADIEKVPLAGRAYARLKDSPEAKKLPNWTVQDKIGAPGERAFTRASNKPLTAGIPGFYTRDGYLNVFLPGLHEAVDAVGKERWIYGEGDKQSGSESSVSGDTIALYRGDFNAAWADLLNDLRIRPLTNLQTAVPVLTALAGPNSALTKLLDAVVKDTDLSPPSAEAKDKDSERIKAMMAATGTASAGASQPYQALRDAMQASNGNPSQISGLVRVISDLYEKVSSASNTPAGISGPSQTETGLNDANQKLLSQSRLQPEPVHYWLSGMAGELNSANSGAAKSAITQAWAGTNQRLCAAATNGRYPFVRGANEISIDDFNHLFAPGGTMDSFFNQNLKQNVNVSSHPWRWQAVGVEPASSSFLLAFERADAIKQAFFAGSSATFHYELSPDSLDSAATNETLDIGGQTLTYAHGPVRPTTMVWPAPGDGGVRLDVEPPSAGGVATFPGIWGPFRMLDSGQIYARTRDGFTFSLPIGGHTVSFIVKSNSALNPFTLRELRAFRCPDVL